MLELAGALGAMGVLTTWGASRASAKEGVDPFKFPDLMITAVEYKFDMPATAEAGWTHVYLDNQGMMDHHAMFLRPHDGMTIEDVQAALETGDFGELLATAMSAGGPNVGPMHKASVAMNLEAGQYLVICAVPDEEGIPHFAHGMQAVLEVTEGSDAGTAPETDASVGLVDMAFEGLPTDATAGTHVWEVANKGNQVHEMVVFRLAEGLSIDQAIQMFMEAPAEASPESSPVVDQTAASPAAEAPQGPPPFENIGGLAPMSPEGMNYAVLDLQAGDYIAVCFVPDAETGAPHFAMGMIAGFTVT